MMLILSVVVMALLFAGIGFYNFLPDDTYITLRYARNVIRGEGFVFNEGERLEGYTNFLWLLLIVLAGKAGAPLLLSARVMSAIFSACVLLLSCWAARDYARSTGGKNWDLALVSILPPMLLVSSAPLLAWSLSGTEIPLFTFLLLGGFLLLQRRKKPESIFALLGLLGLVRPEGLLFCAVAGVFLLLTRSNRKEVLIKGACVLSIIYIPYIAWKWIYFGSLLPNTFYAKTGPFGLMLDNGSKYLFAFFVSYGYFLPIGLILDRNNPAKLHSTVLPLCFILTHWIAVMLLGGDWMPHYRLLLPTMPIILLVLSGGLARTGAERLYSRAPGTGERQDRGTGGADERSAPEAGDTGGDQRKWSNPVPVVTFLLVFLIAVPGGLGYGKFEIERRSVDLFTRLGKRLGVILPPQTRLACGSTGAISFYSGLYVVDILGLTEARIARNGRIVATQPGHMKTDGKHVLSKRPDLLLLGNIQIHRGTRGKNEMKHKIQENDIIIQPEFFEDYIFVNIPLSPQLYLSCYKRKEFPLASAIVME